MNIKPFELNPECPKCGVLDQEFSYSENAGGRVDVGAPTPLEQLLILTCPRCNCEWFMHCKDSRNSANPADIDRKEGDACPITAEQVDALQASWNISDFGNEPEAMWAILQPMLAEWGYARMVDAGRLPPRKIDVDDAKPAPGPRKPGDHFELLVGGHTASLISRRMNRLYIPDAATIDTVRCVSDQTRSPACGTR